MGFKGSIINKDGLLIVSYGMGKTILIKDYRLELNHKDKTYELMFTINENKQRKHIFKYMKNINSINVLNIDILNINWLDPVVIKNGLTIYTNWCERLIKKIDCLEITYICSISEESFVRLFTSRLNSILE